MLSREDECIFGGAVRDLYAEQTFNDIDVCVLDTESFLKKLEKYKPVVEYKDSDFDNPDDIGQLMRVKCNNGVEIDILHSDSPITAPDFDVNTLCLYKDGHLECWDDNSRDVNEVIEKIKRREATFLIEDWISGLSIDDELARKRIDKMLKRGYKILNMDELSIFYETVNIIIDFDSSSISFD